MKKINLIIAVFLLIGLASCDRTFENDVLSTTAPELHVIVKDAGGNKVTGAAVDIFTYIMKDDIVAPRIDQVIDSVNSTIDTSIFTITDTVIISTSRDTVVISSETGESSVLNIITQETVVNVTVDTVITMTDIVLKPESVPLNYPDRTIIGTGTTGADGKAIFTEADITAPGKYGVRAIKGSLSNDAYSGDAGLSDFVVEETPYLLLNDGHTFFNVTIE